MEAIEREMNMLLELRNKVVTQLKDLAKSDPTRDIMSERKALEEKQKELTDKYELECAKYDDFIKEIKKDLKENEDNLTKGVEDVKKLKDEIDKLNKTEEESKKEKKSEEEEDAKVATQLATEIKT
jgi:septal ring factor EnvC (AmiA/AmiB activator)